MHRAVKAAWAVTFALLLCVSSLATNVSLLVATLDLRIVTSIRDAIRTADIASGKEFPITAIGPAPGPPLRYVDADRFEQNRRTFHPDPKIDPRPVFHPSPKFVPATVVHTASRRAVETLVPAQPEGAQATKLSIEPPWRSLPWKNPIPSPTEIKKVVYVHDKDHRGQILDLFI